MPNVQGRTSVRNDEEEKEPSMSKYSTLYEQQFLHNAIIGLQAKLQRRVDQYFLASVIANEHSVLNAHRLEILYILKHSYLDKLTLENILDIHISPSTVDL